MGTGVKMEKELFAELLQSTQEALEHAEGKRDLRTTVLPAAPEPMDSAAVRRLRSRLNASQAVFASFLNVSTKLVQAWEADRRTPEGAALRLLRIAEQAPELLLTSSSSSKPAASRQLAQTSKRPAAKRRAKNRSA
jgi:putative transcriptional regulator